MTLKVCPVVGCATLTEGGRCPTHRAEARRRRGDPAGLHAHRQTRARLLPAAIGQPCPMCGQPMLADQPLDLDHTRARALGGSGSGDRIVHAHCNRRAGGQLGRRLNRK